MLLDWFTYVVSPSEYALQESQDMLFQDLVEEYEDKLNQESLTSKMKEEEEDQMSEICQEEYRKEILARIQEILFKQEQDVIEIDDETAAQRRIQDSGKK